MARPRRTRLITTGALALALLVTLWNRTSSSSAEKQVESQVEHVSSVDHPTMSDATIGQVAAPPMTTGARISAPTESEEERFPTEATPVLVADDDEETARLQAWTVRAASNGTFIPGVPLQVEVKGQVSTHWTDEQGRVELQIKHLDKVSIVGRPAGSSATGLACRVSEKHPRGPSLVADVASVIVVDVPSERPPPNLIPVGQVVLGNGQIVGSALNGVRRDSGPTTYLVAGAPPHRDGPRSSATFLVESNDSLKTPWPCWSSDGLQRPTATAPPTATLDVRILGEPRLTSNSPCQVVLRPSGASHRKPPIAVAFGEVGATVRVEALLPMDVEVLCSSAGVELARTNIVLLSGSNIVELHVPPPPKLIPFDVQVRWEGENISEQTRVLAVAADLTVQPVESELRVVEPGLAHVRLDLQPGVWVLTIFDPLTGEAQLTEHEVRAEDRRTEIHLGVLAHRVPLLIGEAFEDDLDVWLDVDGQGLRQIAESASRGAEVATVLPRATFAWACVAPDGSVWGGSWMDVQSRQHPKSGTQLVLEPARTLRLERILQLRDENTPASDLVRCNGEPCEALGYRFERTRAPATPHVERSGESVSIEIEAVTPWYSVAWLDE